MKSEDYTLVYLCGNTIMFSVSFMIVQINSSSADIKNILHGYSQDNLAFFLKVFLSGMTCHRQQFLFFFLFLFTTAPVMSESQPH